MEVIWMPDPEKDYLDTLNFWYKHNGSPTYSKKIDSAIKALEKEIAKTPYFMAKFYEEFNLYRRTILKGRFLIFYEVKGRKFNQHSTFQKFLSATFGRNSINFIFTPSPFRNNKK